MPRRPVIEFWYDFASTYSYLAAMRIADLAEADGVAVRWRPFLLGPIFAAQGWTNSPFVLVPAKGRNMWRDMEREAARLSLPPVRQPTSFPQNSLSAVRVANLALQEPWLAPFSRAIFARAFAQGLSIAEPAAVAAVLGDLGLDSDSVLRAASAEPNKTRLKAVGEEARSRGIYGAPSFLAEDGELFWGNDRLEAALAWAAGSRPPGVR